MISAPSEMRCRVMPEYSMKTKVAASTSGMAMATTRPARRPRLRKLTTSTITTASNSALVKPPTASSTTAGWLETRCTPTPIGRVATISRMRTLRSLPNCRMLPLAFMPMAMPIAGWPLKRNIGCGGST